MHSDYRDRSGGAIGSSRRRAAKALFSAFLCGGLSLLAATVEAQEPGLGVPGVRGGVVATSEPAAARAGAAILRAGGNAVDAASAVAFALNVVEPQSSGIGGGGFMIVYLAQEGRIEVLDSRERAPAAADPEMFLDSQGDPFSFGLRSTSGVGIGVPGMVRGIALAQDRWGRKTLAEVLQPAIDLAENGFRVSPRLEGSIAQALDGGRLSNEPGNPAYEAARAVFAPGGIGLRENQLLVQPDLAKTLKLLAAEGADAFYRGAVAAAILRTQETAREVPAAADRARLRGRMVLADLETYEPALREPVEADYRGYRIVGMPPPSSGGLTVIYILKALERFPIGDSAQGFGFGSARTLNVMLEAMRLAFADRAVWMGDADFVEVPSRGLISDRYLAGRSALIDPDKRAAEAPADDPRPFDKASLPVSPGPGQTRLAMTVENPEEGLNTTHFTVVDREGNIVTYTNTIESGWGTGLMVPGYGFLLNNELTDFNRVPAANPDPDSFNPGANDAAPFKRPRSSMAPTLIFKDGRPVAAFGSPGGSTIINSVSNTALNLIDHGMNVQEAVDAPRISQTSAKGAPTFEAGFALRTIKDLIALGHDLGDDRLRRIGSVQAIAIGPDGRQYGGGDRRRIGATLSLPARSSGPEGAVE